MTGEDRPDELKGTPDQPEQEASSARTRRRWPWVVGLLAALLLVLAFLPALLGGALLSRFGGDVISAERDSRSSST
ncbi:hypothetical protein IHN32_14155, partial [Deinococcus sp. 14RED07]|uniref:hypothetical protein n=1 Tax=Deinococcus sp. 14RED07 TaxID=2745874 RepID=UPI001E576B5C